MPRTKQPFRLRPRAHRYALEPRQMYDGAALAEAHHHAADPAGAGHDGAAFRALPGAAPRPEAAAHPAPAGDTARPAASVAPPAGTAASQVYVVDRSVANWQSIVGQLPAGSRVVVLDDNASGIDQLANALRGEHGITALHIVSHGASDSISLGTDTVTAANVDAYAAQLRTIGASLDAHGDILLYGCDVASHDSALVSRLADLTHADVAASSDDTGAAARGGDWTLEVSTGRIETRALALDYDGLLAAPTVGTTSKGLTVAEPSVLNAPGADHATLSGWTIRDVGGSGTVTVTATVADPSRGSLSATTFTGTVADAQNWLNGLVFTAADVELGNAAATTTIHVEVKDGSLTGSSDLAVTITPSNDPVTVPDGSLAVPEVDGGGHPSVTVIGTDTLNASDPEVSAGAQDASQIVYDVTALPQYGYLTLDGVRLGVGSVFTQQDVIDGRLSYVHTATGADQDTADGFTAKANDGATPAAQSATVHVTLNVQPVNQPPTVSGTGIVYEGQPANAAGTGNVGQYIVAGGGGDPQDTSLALTITALPAHGTLYYDGTAITAAQVAAGFTIDYANRNLLTYANDGTDGVTSDSFGVTVTDGGGGTGTPASTSATIALDVHAVDDDPRWIDASTQHATVTAAGNGSAGAYSVVLTPAMLGATDVDSSDQEISFVTSQAGLAHGYLLLDGQQLPDGGTFTMADVEAGRVQYVQVAGATAGQTDTFDFQVVDNTTALRWNADGTTFDRIGGVYTGDAQSDTLRNFTFTIDLAQTPAGNGGSWPVHDQTADERSSTYAGMEPSTGTAVGTIDEGGTIVLSGNPGPGTPGLSYTVDGVDPAQVIYTFLGFTSDGGGSGNAGRLQKSSDGVNWVDVNTYGTFTQADLDAGHVRFQHDGDSEDFATTANFSVSAGLVTIQDGTAVPETWTPSFNFYITPANDRPVATGSSGTVIPEGSAADPSYAYITTGQLRITDPDDADSGSSLVGDTLESAPTLHGSDNYAYNNDATGTGALKFEVASLPSGGTLQYKDGSGNWQDVAVGQMLDASLITGDAGSTGLRFVNTGSEVRSTSFTVTAVDRWGATSAADATVAIQITNVNDAPQIARHPNDADPTVPADSPNNIGGAPANNPLTVDEGGFAQITSAMLQAYDPDSTATQVQYTVTGVPAHGRLAYSTDGVHFSNLGVGSSFTQADIAAGRIYYLNDGAEPTGGSYPGTPDDKFTFSISDGDKEQTGNEFWFYTNPTNDAPVVTAPAGPIDIDSATAANNPVRDGAGHYFSVSDPDITDATAGTAGDYVQVTVRLTDADGHALALSDYQSYDAHIAVDGAYAALEHTSHAGNQDYLVLYGTRDQVNAALQTLTLTFGSDLDRTFQLQVIADDRQRDGSGALTAGANGGALNQPVTPGNGTSPTPVDTTEYDWYGTDAVPVDGNLSADQVVVRASSVNEPATLGGPGARTTYEDQATYIGGGFVVSDPESAAFDTPVTVTLTVAQGTLGIGGGGTQTSATASAGGSEAVTIAGDNTGTLTLTGRASDIQALLNDPALGLTYRSAANDNADHNGADAGDVTLTMSLDDSGSRIGGDTGSGSQANEPADLSIPITITAVNDAPTVDAGTGTVYLTGATPITGVHVGDVDLDDGTVADGETDGVMQVIVRITDNTGAALTESDYAGVTFGSSASVAGLVIDNDNGSNGTTGHALVIRGTEAQINAYLAGLTLDTSSATALNSNVDAAYHLQVIADDRLYDAASGSLVDTDGATAGTQAGANGGPNNATAGGTQAVPTDAFDPYATTTLPGNLAQNVALGSRDIFPTQINDPAQIHVGDLSVNEGSATVALPPLTVTDADAGDGTLHVTVTLPPGFTFSAIGGSGGTIASGTGVGHATLELDGTQAQITDRLSHLTVNLPDAPGTPGAADWNGGFQVTVVVNDEGLHGERPATLTGDTDNPAADPGDYSYADGSSAALLTTRTYTVTVQPVNDAPAVVNGNSATLPAATEDTSGVSGHTVGELFGPHFDDSRDTVDNSGYGASGGSSADSFQGIAITGNSAVAGQGTWQYYDGAAWVDIPANLSNSHALVLDAGTQVRFVPAANFQGTPGQLTARLVETDANGDATGTAPPAQGGFVNLTGGASGGSTRYSSGAVTLSTSVANVNDQPTLDATRNLTTNEDATYATTAGGLASSYSDAIDNQTAIPGGGNASGALGYVAIVGNDTDAAKGHWEYSLDGGATWQAVPTSGLGDGNAIVLNAAAPLRFVPTADYNGPVPGGLTIRASDSTAAADTGVSATGAGQHLTGIDDTAGSTSHWSKTSTVSVNVTAVQDAHDDTATTHVNVPVTTTVLGNDSFGNPDAAVTGVTQGQHGSVTINPDGTVTYTPNAGYTGTDTYTYTVTSGGVTETASVTVTIGNTPPAPVHDAQSIPEDTPATGNVLTNDTDPDGDPLTVTGFDVGGTHYAAGQTATISGVGSLTLNGDGSYTFTPVADWNGTVPTVTYTVDDGTGSTSATATATLDLTVTPVQDAHDDSATTHANVPVTTTVLGNDSFGNPDAAVTGVTQGQHGSVTINPDGTVTYTPNAGYTGTDTYTYTVTSGGVTETASVTVTVGNTPPAAAGHATVDEAGLVDGSGAQTTAGTIDIAAPLGLDSVTIGGRTLSAEQLAALSPEHPVTIATADGTLVLTGFTPTAATGDVTTAGTLAYSYALGGAVAQPGADHSSDVIAITVKDTIGGSSNGSLVVDIVDDVPTARDDAAAIDQDASQRTASGNVFTGDGSPNGADRIGADGAGAGGPVTAVASANLGQAGTIGGASRGEYGTLTLNADGSYSYALDPSNPQVAALDSNRTLAEVFVYTITDADGDTSQARLTITIRGATPPIQARWGDQIFPIAYEHAMRDIRQGYEPALFILPALDEVQRDTQRDEAALIAGFDAAAADAAATPLDAGDAQHVLRDGVAFSRRLLAEIRGSARVSPNGFGLGSRALWDDFTPFAPRRVADPEQAGRPAHAEGRHGERHHARPDAHGHRDRPQAAHGAATPAPHAGDAGHAEATLLVPAPAAPPAGAPSLSAQIAALAHAAAAPVPPQVAATLLASARPSTPPRH